MSDPRFPSRILRRFVEAAAVELGADHFSAVLSLSQLPPEWAGSDGFRKMDELVSARTYATLQSAMRAYYGRGARGALLRVGQRMWHSLLEDASLPGKVQATVIRRLPLNARCKSALEFLARLLNAQPDEMTVHTLDLNLLLVDHVSPTTQGIQHETPICFVTQGLIGESLLWATGQRYDVEEISCRARGDHSCEFTVVTEKAA